MKLSAVKFAYGRSSELTGVTARSRGARYRYHGARVVHGVHRSESMSRKMSAASLNLAGSARLMRVTSSGEE